MRHSIKERLWSTSAAEKACHPPTSSRNYLRMVNDDLRHAKTFPYFMNCFNAPHDILFYRNWIYHSSVFMSYCNSSELIQLSIWFQNLLPSLEKDLNPDSLHFSHEKAHEVCGFCQAIVGKLVRSFWKTSRESYNISPWVFMLIHATLLFLGAS